MSKGFAKLDREIFSNPIFKNPNTVAVYVHLLLNAAYQPTSINANGLNINLDKDEFFFSFRGIAAHTGCTVSAVRNSIERLNKQHIIRTVKKRWGCLVKLTSEEVTLCHNTEYSTPNDTLHDIMSDTPSAHINKKERILKEVRNKEVLVQLPLKPRIGFDQVWQVWPRKLNRKKASELFARIQKTIPNIGELILEDLERRRAAGIWTEMKFIPHMTTYLNGARWEDEITPLENETIGHEYKHVKDREDSLKMALHYGEQFEKNGGLL